LREIMKRARDGGDAVARQVFIAGMNGAITGSNVDTGQLRSGWYAAVDGDSAEVPPEGTATPAGEVAARATTVVLQAPSFRRYTLSNNVEHAAYLETGALIPKDPGPSSDSRDGRLGVIFVSGGFTTHSPEGLLVKAILEARRAIRAYDGKGLAE
jgi:hypothetical protein